MNIALNHLLLNLFKRFDAAVKAFCLLKSSGPHLLQANLLPTQIIEISLEKVTIA
jgi:hypothetical protein